MDTMLKALCCANCPQPSRLPFHTPHGVEPCISAHRANSSRNLRLMHVRSDAEPTKAAATASCPATVPSGDRRHVPDRTRVSELPSDHPPTSNQRSSLPHTPHIPSSMALYAQAPSPMMADTSAPIQQSAPRSLHMNASLRRSRFDPYQDNGGSILAIAGADFTVIAGDTRQSLDYNIQTRYARKVWQLCVARACSG